MVYSDEIQRSAIEALRELSVSDPAVQLNFARYTKAMGEMLRGRPIDRVGAKHVAAAACFTMDGSDRDYLMAASVRLEIDQVILTFDVDDPLGMPIGLVAVRLEEREVAFYGRCRLWAPANDGRLLVVPEADAERHFDAGGENLVERWRRLPGSLGAGERRAWHRLKILASSFDLDDLERARLNVLSKGDDGRLTATVKRLAA